jgi:acyl-CoA dehydrogenase
VPREVLREMGELGFLGMRYPDEYGGGALDARATACWPRNSAARPSAASPSPCWCIPTWLRRTWQRRLAGAAREVPAGIVAGRKITAVGITEPGAGSDVAGHPHDRACATARLGAQRHEDVHHQRRAGRLYFVAAKTDPEAGQPKGMSMFIVEKGTPGFRSAARSTRPAGARPTPPSWCSTTAACRPATCWARRTAASTPS